MEDGSGRKYLKKKIRTGFLELSPNESSIIVHYEVEATVLSADGQSVVTEKKPGEKRIKVRPFNEGRSVSEVAHEIIDKCKILHASKLPQVEELLYELKRREMQIDYHEEDVRDLQDLARHRMAEERYREEHRKGSYNSPRDEEQPSIDELDSYLELLYENMEEKVKATFMISQLARRMEFMEPILCHSTLLGALARVLREDGRKNVDLALNIISVFLVFSNFTQFHQVILDHQVGNMTMNLVELEIQRTEARLQMEGPECLAVVAAPGATSEKEMRMIIGNRKQEKLLYVSLYLLLNISEDVAIEKKMKKKNIVGLLCKMLARKSIELLILTVVFLKKLSVYAENKDTMKECHIVKPLSAFVSCKHDALVVPTLRLLKNISFDPAVRQEMVKHGLISKLIDLMHKPSCHRLVLGLLYHLSMDDKCKAMFTHTEAVPIILEMLLETANPLATPELIALAINLTANAQNAEVMCEGDGLELIVSRGVRLHDPLIFKVIRNLSQQQQLKPRFVPHARDMMRLLKDPETSSELLVEVLGTLGNLSVEGVGFNTLVAEFDVLRFLSTHFQPGVVEDDILLEVVILIGTIATEVTAPGIASVGLVGKLCKLFTEKREDEEMVLQIVFTISRLLQFEPTMSTFLRNEQMIDFLVELLQEKNKQLVKVADMVLDMIMEADAQLADKIRQLKFEAYNHKWLEVIEEDLTEEERHAAMYNEATRGSHGMPMASADTMTGPSSDDSASDFSPSSNASPHWKPSSGSQDGSPSPSPGSPYYEVSKSYGVSVGDYHDSHGYL